MIRTLDRPSAYQGQGNKEAGQKRPGVFAFYDPGPQLQNFTKEICFKNKTLCHKPTTRLTRREFCKADFFGASPVASALDLCMGRDPDTQTFTLSCSFRSADAEQDGVCSLPEFSLLWQAPTCRLRR